MMRNDLLCGVAKIALCEFGTPFPKAAVDAAVDNLAAWAAEPPNGDDK